MVTHDARRVTTTGTLGTVLRFPRGLGPLSTRVPSYPSPPLPTWGSRTTCFKTGLEVHFEAPGPPRRDPHGNGSTRGVPPRTSGSDTLLCTLPGGRASRPASVPGPLKAGLRGWEWKIWCKVPGSVSKETGFWGRPETPDVLGEGPGRRFPWWGPGSPSVPVDKRLPTPPRPPRTDPSPPTSDPDSGLEDCGRRSWVGSRRAKAQDCPEGPEAPLCAQVILLPFLEYLPNNRVNPENT